jgi:ankyrin repeat protein
VEDGDNPECARLLVETGEDPTVQWTAPEKGYMREWSGTPLHFAVLSGHVNITRYLASLAWDFPGLLAIRNKHNEDALGAAIRLENNEITTILEGVQVRLFVVVCAL